MRILTPACKLKDSHAALPRIDDVEGGTVKRSTWTFLSNHGRLFAYIARKRGGTMEVMARETGLCTRAVEEIIRDMEKDGYLARERVGRCNRYTLRPEMPMRHRLERRHTVGELLSALGCEKVNRRLEKF